MNEKFTLWSYRISEWGGAWQTAVIWVVLIVAWIALGPVSHWSDGWQLLINTPSTIYELFQGIFCAAAVARVEYNNGLLHQKIYELLERAEGGIEQIEDELDIQVELEPKCEGRNRNG